MINKILNILILVIFSFGIFGASQLVRNEYLLKNICPKILGIPACYIIMACLVIPLIAHVFHASDKIYFIGTGIALTIATYGSITQLLGINECPKTSSGMPMCYISFFIFFSLVLLKLINNRIPTA